MKKAAKKRTNWKARVEALELIVDDRTFHRDLARVDCQTLRNKLAETVKRAEDAEKHNAILIAERRPKDYEWAFEAMESSLPRSSDSPVLIVGGETQPTRWQRFKAWALKLVRSGK